MASFKFSCYWAYDKILNVNFWCVMAEKVTAEQQENEEIKVLYIKPIFLRFTGFFIWTPSPDSVPESYFKSSGFICKACALEMKIFLVELNKSFWWLSNASGVSWYFSKIYIW